MNDNVVVVAPAADLAQLATQINREHAEAVAALKTGTERARACGELLLRAKKLCRHGEWLPWLTKNCPQVTVRQSQKYMRLARKWDELQFKCEPGSLLAINSALAELASPSGTRDDTDFTEEDLVPPEWCRKVCPEPDDELQNMLRRGETFACNVWPIGEVTVPVPDGFWPVDTPAIHVIRPRDEPPGARGRYWYVGVFGWKSICTKPAIPAWQVQYTVNHFLRQICGPGVEYQVIGGWHANPEYPWLHDEHPFFTVPKWKPGMTPEAFAEFLAFHDGLQ